MNSRIGASEYLSNCTYDGTYYQYCIDAPVKGTINGIWHYLAPPGGNSVTAFPDPPYSSLQAGWALDVMETNRGDIYAQENWMFNLSVFDADVFSPNAKALSPAVTISVITGGTGQYEGASGWIGMIFDDSGQWRGFMKGEICTPDE